MAHSVPAPRKSPSRWAIRVLGVLCGALLLQGRASGAGPNDLLVVVNTTNPVAKLNSSELRAIFQTSKRTWDSGTSIEPVNLPEKSPPRQTFDRVVLGFDPDATIRYWIDRRVRGEARPPRKASSPAAVVTLVAASSGAIGYVPFGGSLDPHVKVVARVVDGSVKPP